MHARRYVNQLYPPVLFGVVPPYAKLKGGGTLVVSGTNFAPTDQLACYVEFDSQYAPCHNLPPP